MMGVCLQEREYLLRLAKKLTWQLGYMVEQNVESPLMPAVAEKFEQYGAEDGGGLTEKFCDVIRIESKKLAKMVKDDGVKGNA
jgi:glycerol-3-phosphate dehydrogenase